MRAFFHATALAKSDVTGVIRTTVAQVENTSRAGLALAVSFTHLLGI